MAGSSLFGARRLRRPGQPAEVKVPEDARTIDLPGTTLLPGLIDAHTHVLLHPYDEAFWDDQVLKEALALRVCRATNHLRQHTTFRVHHDPRPGDRRGRVCRRRAQAGGRPGDCPRPADAGGDASDRGDGQLRTQRVCP